MSIACFLLFCPVDMLSVLRSLMCVCLCVFLVGGWGEGVYITWIKSFSSVCGEQKLKTISYRPNFDRYCLDECTVMESNRVAAVLYSLFPLHGETESEIVLSSPTTSTSFVYCLCFDEQSRWR